MVLYEATSTYHLLCVLVDQIGQGCPESLLLVSNGLEKKYPQINKLEKFFTKIKTYDIHYAINHNYEDTRKYFFALIGDINSEKIFYEKIYCNCEHYSFGYFLAREKIPHIYCEDGAGLLSRPEILIDLNDKIPSRKEFNKKCIQLGLYDGSNENVISCRCNLNAQIDKFKRKNTENFDVVEKMKVLDKVNRNEVIDFFIPGLIIDIPVNSKLLLTQHFANLLTLSFEEQILIYQFLIDYFLGDENLVIKPHPDDLMYYSQLFPKAEIIREKFPSEFLPFVLENQPECVATISSTAIFNLRGHYPKVFELDSRYEQDFEMTHRYYTAVCLAKEFGLTIICIGANDSLVRRLCETVGADNLEIKTDMSTRYSKSIILVDDVTDQGEQGRENILKVLQEVPQDSCVLFINSKQNYCWYDYEQRFLWRNIVPVVLRKTILEPRTEDFYASVDDEVIYFYSSNEEMLLMAKDIKIEKELPHVGISLNVQHLTPEQEKIKMLEGILAATEKRLLYYIDKERAEK